MAKSVIVYESKYGSTAEAVKDMSRFLGCPAYRASEFPFTRKDEFDSYVIGGPIFIAEMDKRVTDFVKDNADWLKKKKVALFCACLAPPQAAANYLQPLKQMLGDCVAYTGSVIGRINVAQLDAADRENMTGYCQKMGRPLVDMNFGSEADRARVCSELSGACGLV